MYPTSPHGPPPSSFTPEVAASPLLHSAHAPGTAVSWVSFSLVLIRAPVDHHSSLHPGLSVARATFPAVTSLQLLPPQLRGQQGAGILAVAQDLHPDVAEVGQALVIGGVLPQPDVGGLGASCGHSRRQEREQAGGQGFIRQTSVLSLAHPLWPPGPPCSPRGPQRHYGPSSWMGSLRPSEAREVAELSPSARVPFTPSLQS